MKRFLIFLPLGPLLGFLVFLLRNASAGKIVGGLIGFVFGLPFAYLFGLPIVLVMWVEDWFLSGKIGLGMKVATSACVGYLHRNAAAYKRPPPSTSSDSKFWYCWRNSSCRVFVAR
jgi:hypothetical protein